MGSTPTWATDEYPGGPAEWSSLSQSEDRGFESHPGYCDKRVGWALASPSGCNPPAWLCRFDSCPTHCRNGPFDFWRGRRSFKPARGDRNPYGLLHGRRVVTTGVCSWESILPPKQAQRVRLPPSLLTVSVAEQPRHHFAEVDRRVRLPPDTLITPCDAAGVATCLSSRRDGFESRTGR